MKEERDASIFRHYEEKKIYIYFLLKERIKEAKSYKSKQRKENPDLKKKLSNSQTIWDQQGIKKTKK